MKTLQCPYCNEHKAEHHVISCELCGDPVCTECTNDYTCPDCADRDTLMEIEIVGIRNEGSIIIVQAITKEDSLIHIYFDANCFYDFLDSESDDDGNIDFRGKKYFYNEDNNTISPDIDDVLF